MSAEHSRLSALQAPTARVLVRVASSLPHHHAARYGKAALLCARAPIEPLLSSFQRV